MAKKNINYLYCYVVLDTTNHIIKRFDRYEDALNYKLCIASRPDWKIKKGRKQYHSTEKQRDYVKTIAYYLNIEFRGDINNGWECSDFISMYKDDYESFINELQGDYFDGI